MDTLEGPPYPRTLLIREVFSFWMGFDIGRRSVLYRFLSICSSFSLFSVGSIIILAALAYGEYRSAFYSIY